MSFESVFKEARARADAYIQDAVIKSKAVLETLHKKTDHGRDDAWLGEFTERIKREGDAWERDYQEIRAIQQRQAAAQDPEQIRASSDKMSQQYQYIEMGRKSGTDVLPASVEYANSQAADRARGALSAGGKQSAAHERYLHETARDLTDNPPSQRDVDRANEIIAEWDRDNQNALERSGRWEASIDAWLEQARANTRISVLKQQFEREFDAMDAPRRAAERERQAAAEKAAADPKVVAARERQLEIRQYAQTRTAEVLRSIGIDPKPFLDEVRATRTGEPKREFDRAEDRKAEALSRAGFAPNAKAEEPQREMSHGERVRARIERVARAVGIEPPKRDEPQREEPPQKPPTRNRTHDHDRGGR